MAGCGNRAVREPMGKFASKTCTYIPIYLAPHLYHFPSLSMRTIPARKGRFSSECFHHHHHTTKLSFRTLGIDHDYSYVVYPLASILYNWICWQFGNILVKRHVSRLHVSYRLSCLSRETSLRYIPMRTSNSYKAFETTMREYSTVQFNFMFTGISFYQSFFYSFIFFFFFFFLKFRKCG